MIWLTFTWLVEHKHNQHELKFDLRQNQKKNVAAMRRTAAVINSFRITTSGFQVFECKIRRIIVPKDVFLWSRIITCIIFIWIKNIIPHSRHISCEKKRSFSHLSERHRFTEIINS